MLAGPVISNHKPACTNKGVKECKETYFGLVTNGNLVLLNY